MFKHWWLKAVGGTHELGSAKFKLERTGILSQQVGDGACSICHLHLAAVRGHSLPVCYLFVGESSDIWKVQVLRPVEK